MDESKQYPNKVEKPHLEFLHLYLRSATPQEEINHWKSKFTELEQEFADFQLTSKEVEAELETELDKNEKLLKEAQNQNQRLKLDQEELTVSLTSIFSI